MPCKCLPLCLSLVQCWPPPQMRTFSSHLLSHELNCISSPSEVIWSYALAQVRKLFTVKLENTVLLTQGKHCSQRWSTSVHIELQLAGTSKNLWSISNQILGEVNIFSAAGFRVKEVCSPLLYKAAQQLFGGPHLLDRQAFGRRTLPNR